MVRQGFTMTVIPDTYRDDRYQVLLSSSAWDGHDCIASRYVLKADLALPNGAVAPGDFNMWLDHMMDVVTDLAQRTLTTVDASSVSASAVYEERASKNVRHV